MKKFIFLSLFFSAYHSYGQRNATESIERAGVGDQAKDFTVQMINGETITLSDLKGQVVLLNFWRTSCPPCINELRAFPSKIVEPFKNSAFVLLPISTGESKRDVERTMGKVLEQREQTSC